MCVVNSSDPVFVVCAVDKLGRPWVASGTKPATFFQVWPLLNRDASAGFFVMLADHCTLLEARALAVRANGTRAARENGLKFRYSTAAALEAYTFKYTGRA